MAVDLNLIHVLDLFEYRGILSNTHAEKLLCSPILIENIISILAQFLHVRPNKHLAELDKVTVILVVNLDDTPWVSTTTDVTAIGSLDKLIRTNNGERNFASNFLGLGDSLLILILVSGRLENLNVVVGNVSKNLHSADK